jgi:hypothetical protein
MNGGRVHAVVVSSSFMPGRPRSPCWRRSRIVSASGPPSIFARWAAASQRGSLGAIPLVVLTRAEGGYGKNLDKPEEELERARLDAQRGLAELSSAGTQRIVNAGHNMHLEAPDVLVQAIRDVIGAVKR